MDYSLRKFAVLTALAPIVFLGGAIILLFGIWQGISDMVPVGGVILVLGILMGISSFVAFSRARQRFVAREARLLTCPRITARVTRVVPNPDVIINGQHPWMVEAKDNDGATYTQTFSFTKPSVQEGHRVDIGIDPDDPAQYLIIIPEMLQEQNRHLAQAHGATTEGEADE
ncbi:hypothetical protein [Trueperella bialowiezensis]|uniref:DUF3592 domain-containing protein n=1 Tax=Trueperella bialowiezensis TaxID=312285 RepID=A0A448PFB2_9ACTO|nr:hypothetical protein [Trueperella bialowiezensis]VEI13629.1 Uncharacterised protein [Trueperella bialowiezensis]